MIGRGSRSFGKCIGYVYLVNELAKTLSSYGFIDYLNSLDNLKFPEPAPKILASAVRAFRSKLFEEQSLKMARSAILETLGDRQWVSNWSNISQVKTLYRPNVQKMLNAVVNFKTCNTDAIDKAL
jgi:hypothetical protein